MPLSYTLSNEATVDLECGHCVHQECYLNLNKIDGASGSSSVPFCGICGDYSQPADREFNAMDHVQLPAQETPKTPTEKIINFESILTPPPTYKRDRKNAPSTFTSCLVYREPLENLCPLRLSAIPEYNHIGPDCAKLSLLIEVGTTDRVEYDHDFRFSAADINIARSCVEELSGLSFRAKPLSVVSMGKLRLTNFMSVSFSGTSWNRSYVYLLTNMLIICRTDSEGQKVVKSTIRVEDILQVRIEEVQNHSVLSLVMSNDTMRKLYLAADSTDTLRKWQLALYYPDYEFPLAPRLSEDSFDGRYRNISAPLSPLDLILCFSMTGLEDTARARAVLQAVHNTKCKMGFFDRLGVIFFNSDVIKSVPLQHRSWKKWDMISDELESITRHCQSEEPFDYNKLLVHCEELLSEHNASLSMASIIIVSDLRDSKLSYLPWTFVKAGTPINTISTSPCCAFPLSIISSRTGGGFAHLDNGDAMLGALDRLVRTEREHCQKDCRLEITPASGVTITKVSGWKRSPDESCIAGSVPRGPYAQTTEGPVQLPTGTTQIEIGRLHFGEVRSIVVDVELQEGSHVPDGSYQTLLQISATSTDVLCVNSQIQHKITGEASILVSKQAQLSLCSSSLVYKTLSSFAFDSLEHALLLLKNEARRGAFEEIMRAWRYLQSTVPAHCLASTDEVGSSKIQCLLSAVDSRFDKWCNDIFGAPSSSPDLIVRIVSFLWAIGSDSAFREIVEL